MMKTRSSRSFRLQSRASENSLLPEKFRSNGWTAVNYVPRHIPEWKWQEIFDDEETEYIINSIYEEIIQSALDEIYNVYIEKTAFPFVIHCFHLAWLQLFNWVNLRYDPGETSLCSVKNWIGDKEQLQSPIDPWCFRSVEVCKIETDDLSCKNSLTMCKDSSLDDSVGNQCKL